MIYLNPVSINLGLTNQACIETLKFHLRLLNDFPGRFVLCVTSNCFDEFISDGISFKRFVSEINDGELKELMTTIFANSTCYIGGFDDGYSVSCRGSVEKFLAFGYYLNASKGVNYILSIHNDPCWEVNKISVTHNMRVCDYINLPKLYAQGFVNAMADWMVIIKNICLHKGKGEGYLPYSHSLESSFPKWLSLLYKYGINDTQQKISCIRKLGEFVADVNEYSYSEIISNKNRSGQVIRDIYFNNVLGVYISVDVRHGCFELLDLKGKHLGELSFWGEMTKRPDKTGAHNIIV